MQRLTDLQQKSLELDSVDEASVPGLETSMISLDLICSEARDTTGDGPAAAAVLLTGQCGKVSPS